MEHTKSVCIDSLKGTLSIRVFLFNYPEHVAEQLASLPLPPEGITEGITASSRALTQSTRQAPMLCLPPVLQPLPFCLLFSKQLGSGMTSMLCCCSRRIPTY